MNNQEFLNSRERKIHTSLNELFERANLSEEEKAIFLKYQKDCEYWLLRSKLQYSKPFLPSKTNFIKLLAIVLINLDSDNVIGQQAKVVKKMFSDKKIHKVITTKGNGLRFKKNSNNLENSYFELKILSYFLKNDFKIKLPDDKIIGKKIPEFKAQRSTLKINIEAKKLDIDKILDNTYGDSFTRDFNTKLSQIEINKGYKRILGQFERNYNSAIEKYKDSDEKEFFIIFIESSYLINNLGADTIDFINNLRVNWSKHNYKRLIGVILPDSEKTIFIKNPICDNNAINEIEKIGIYNFHNYQPEIIK